MLLIISFTLAILYLTKVNLVFAGHDKSAGTVIKEDLPYIACAVCEKTVSGCPSPKIITIK